MNKLTPRTWVYILSGVGLLALVLLAISLNALQLAPGHPVSFQQLAPPVTTDDSNTSWTRYLTAAFRVLMIIFWILVPILIIAMLIDKENRKRFLISIAIALPFVLLLLYLSTLKPAQKAAADLNLGNFSIATPMPGEVATPPAAEYTPPPGWVTSLATALIAVAAASAVIGAVFVIWRRWKSQSQLQEPLKDVQREAQAALDAIYAGNDLRDTILRCYLQMTEVLRQYRGISRGNDMTPHEFELYLEKRGLPQEPVKQLTRLFEQVRYGALQPKGQDEQIAISSLTAIIRAIQKPRGE